MHFNRGLECDVTNCIPPVSAIFEGNVHTVLLLKHCIMVLTCCVVDCKNHGGREKVSFYDILAVIEHHGEKRLSFHPNGIKNG